MPETDWLIVQSQLVQPPPPPPDTPRVFAVVADAVPAGFVAKVKQYSSLSEMTDDGWVAGQAGYDALARIFAATPTTDAVGRVPVIRREATVAEVWTVDILATDDGTYTLSANGTELVSVAAVGLTDIQIRDALIAGLVGSGYTGAIVDTDTLTVTNDIAGVPFTLTQTSPNANANMSVGSGPTTPAVGIFADLDAAYLEVPFWGVHPVGSGGVSDADLDEARRWAGADTTNRRNLVLAETDDPAVYDPLDLDNLAYTWRVAQYKRASLTHHPDPTEYMLAAMIGRIGGSFPGARAWHRLPLAGSTETLVTANRTADATATMKARRMSWTERFGGPLSDLEFIGGYVPSGNFIYQVWAEDWWFYTIRAAVGAAMKANEGVNLDPAGLQGVADRVASAMLPLVNEGVIAPDFTVTFTPLADVPVGELAIGDFQTTGRILASATITPKLRALRVSAEFALV